jgi:hypothetical protein
MGERKNRMIYTTHNQNLILRGTRKSHVRNGINDLREELRKVYRDGAQGKLDRQEMFSMIDRFLALYRELPTRFPHKSEFLHDAVTNIFQNSEEYFASQETTSAHVGYSPERVWNAWQSLCGCDELLHTPFFAMHFTLIPCKEATYAICIPYKTGIMEAHKIGECPHTRYKVGK